ncbi:hypothetical protein Pint_09142 [Pistacia integerrima]|uniref:Uncharacterized protein n=2 Tax=Pistacia TaxID=55512 RepID=A0ACC1AF90_9ROSI|nr:hypothetical protein Pint_09142 [Pistacia integerrima]KAJ0086225.1 hypothetical protein Patl1_09305 [Pistacia atlantica]
MYSERYWK